MRTRMPHIKPVVAVQVTEPEEYELDNGIVVYGFNGAANDIIKIDLVFDAGRWVEDGKLTSSAVSSLIKSGTDKETAYELEAAIDYLGGTIKASSGYNSFTISLYCMTRHLESCLAIFVRVLHRCIFPEDEIALYKSNGLSRLKVNLLKNDYVGDMIFKELLFGEDHPYGYQITAEMINALDGESIREYYGSRLAMGRCFIGLAGKYSRTDIDLLNKYLGQRKDWGVKHAKAKKRNWKAEPSAERKVTRELKDSVQASIYIGMACISRSHEDFHALTLLNLIYGGYFGSRLMKNIREDKGLTYGIYSFVQPYRYGAVFAINTDTAIGYAEQVLHEIYAEMQRLKQQPIGEKELGKAKNYMMGRLLDQVDGPFKSAGTFTGLKSHEIPLSYIKETEQAILNLGRDELMRTAQKYFMEENMYEVIVK